MPKKDVPTVAYIKVEGDCLPPVRTLEDLALYMAEPKKGKEMKLDTLDDAQSGIVREMIKARREYGDLAGIKKNRPDLFRAWAERGNLKQEILRRRETRDINHEEK